ncbi:unnamed protein product [Closterium sp. NIES-65]|nr:unnamed protein product [Closterium sp. NIES-65]
MAVIVTQVKDGLDDTSILCNDDFCYRIPDPLLRLNNEDKDGGVKGEFERRADEDEGAADVADGGWEDGAGGDGEGGGEGRRVAGGEETVQGDEPTDVDTRSDATCPELLLLRHGTHLFPMGFPSTLAASTYQPPHLPPRPLESPSALALCLHAASLPSLPFFSPFIAPPPPLENAEVAMHRRVMQEIANLTALLEGDPGNAHLLLERGKAWFSMHRFPEAIADRQRAVALLAASASTSNPYSSGRSGSSPGDYHPSDLPRALLSLGQALHAAGRVQEAVEANERAAVLLSSQNLTSPATSAAATSAEDSSAAASSAEWVTVSAAWGMVGLSYHWLPDADKAERAFRLAVEADPRNPKAYQGWAMHRQMTGDLKTQEPQGLPGLGNAPTDDRGFEMTVGLEVTFESTQKMTGGLEVTFESTQKMTGGLEVTFESTQKMTGGLEVTFESTQKMTGGLEVTFESTQKMTGGLEVTFESTQKMTGGLEVTFESTQKMTGGLEVTFESTQTMTGGLEVTFESTQKMTGGLEWVSLAPVEEWVSLAPVEEWVSLAPVEEWVSLAPVEEWVSLAPVEEWVSLAPVEEWVSLAPVEEWVSLAPVEEWVSLAPVEEWVSLAPVEEWVSLAPVEEWVSLAPVEEWVSLAPVEEWVSLAPVEEWVSLAPVEEWVSLAPVEEWVSLAPVEEWVSLAPVEEWVSLAPVEEWVSLAPVEEWVSLAPVEEWVSLAPVEEWVSLAPVEEWVSLAPVEEWVSLAPVEEWVSLAPVEEWVSLAPVEEWVSLAPVEEWVSLAPVEEWVSLAPVEEWVSLAPVEEWVSLAPVEEWVSLAPVEEWVSLAPVEEWVSLAPVEEWVSLAPVEEWVSLAPVEEWVSLAPVEEWVSLAPVEEWVSLAPVEEWVSLAPVEEWVSLAPVEEWVSLAPVEEWVSLAPVEEWVSLAPVEEWVSLAPCPCFPFPACPRARSLSTGGISIPMPHLSTCRFQPRPRQGRRSSPRLANSLVACMKKCFETSQNTCRFQPCPCQGRLGTIPLLTKWVSLAPVEEWASLAPVEEWVSLAPVEEWVSLAPVEEWISLAPVEEWASLAPVEEWVSLAPVEEWVSLAPVEEWISLAPVEEWVSLAPVEEWASLAPVEEWVSLAPLAFLSFPSPPHVLALPTRFSSTFSPSKHPGHHFFLLTKWFFLALRTPKGQLFPLLSLSSPNVHPIPRQRHHPSPHQVLLPRPSHSQPQGLLSPTTPDAPTVFFDITYPTPPFNSPTPAPEAPSLSSSSGSPLLLAPSRLIRLPLLPSPRALLLALPSPHAFPSPSLLPHARGTIPLLTKWVSLAPLAATPRFTRLPLLPNPSSSPLPHTRGTIPLLTKWVSLAPRTPKDHLTLGCCRQALGHMAHAVSAALRTGSVVELVWGLFIGFQGSGFRVPGPPAHPQGPPHPGLLSAGPGAHAVSAFTRIIDAPSDPEDAPFLFHAFYQREIATLTAKHLESSFSDYSIEGAFSTKFLNHYAFKKDPSSIFPGCALLPPAALNCSLFVFIPFLSYPLKLQNHWAYKKDPTNLFPGYAMLPPAASLAPLPFRLPVLSPPAPTCPLPPISPNPLLEPNHWAYKKDPTEGNTEIDAISTSRPLLWSSPHSVRITALHSRVFLTPYHRSSPPCVPHSLSPLFNPVIVSPNRSTDRAAGMEALAVMQSARVHSLLCKSFYSSSPLFTYRHPPFTLLFPKWQHRAAGMAALEVMQSARATWRWWAKRKHKHGLTEGRRAADPRKNEEEEEDEEEDEEEEEDDEEEEEEGVGMVVDGWRGVFDIGARWRQLVDPCEPVLWMERVRSVDSSLVGNSVTPISVFRQLTTKYVLSFPHFPLSVPDSSPLIATPCKLPSAPQCPPFSSADPSLVGNSVTPISVFRQLTTKYADYYNRTLSVIKSTMQQHHHVLSNIHLMPVLSLPPPSEPSQTLSVLKSMMQQHVETLSVLKTYMQQQHHVFSNVDDLRIPLSKREVARVEAAATEYHLFDIVGQSFFVVTPCHSAAFPGLLLNGTEVLIRIAFETS